MVSLKLLTLLGQYNVELSNECVRSIQCIPDRSGKAVGESIGPGGLDPILLQPPKIKTSTTTVAKVGDTFEKTMLRKILIFW